MKSAAWEGLGCGSRFYGRFSIGGDHMHAYRNLPPHDDIVALITKIRKFQLIFLLDRLSDYPSVYTVKFVSTSASKLDPLLICFDELFFPHQIPDYNTMDTRLASKRYQDNYSWLLYNFFTFLDNCSTYTYQV